MKKKKVGRPIKGDSRSIAVSVRLEEKTIRQLKKKFKTISNGIQEIVSSYLEGSK